MSPQEPRRSKRRLDANEPSDRTEPNKRARAENVRREEIGESSGSRANQRTVQSDFNAMLDNGQLRAQVEILQEANLQLQEQVRVLSEELRATADRAKALEEQLKESNTRAGNSQSRLDANRLRAPQQRERSHPRPAEEEPLSGPIVPAARPLPRLQNRNYYAERISVHKPPDKNNKEAVAEFYRRGGVSQRGKLLMKEGVDLTSPEVQAYQPARPVPRDATPEEESRRYNVNLEDEERRMYFDVNFNDSHEAIQMGLKPEYKEGSVWENNVSVNRASLYYCSEDAAVKTRALERWARLDITTGERTPPPPRYDNRPRQSSRGL